MLKGLRAKSKKNQKGFTLIELLAVIVILAILAAIAIPSVISIINSQNNKAAAQDALTVINAAKLFVADHNVTGSTTVDIHQSTANQGQTTISSTDGWRNYASKSSSSLDTGIVVHYTPDANGGTYTIDDPSLNGISGLSTTGESESNLINFNK